jgi:hypothetical protein
MPPRLTYERQRRTASLVKLKSTVTDRNPNPVELDSIVRDYASKVEKNRLVD